MYKYILYISLKTTYIHKYSFAIDKYLYLYLK